MTRGCGNNSGQLGDSRPPHVTDPTKRHAAVAVVVVDSELGEDRVDPAPVDDWIAGDRWKPDSTAGWSTCPGRRLPIVPQGISPEFALRAMGAAWRARGPGRDGGRGRAAGTGRRGRYRVARLDRAGLLDDYPTRSGYVITPVVIWGGGSSIPVPHPTRWWRSTGLGYTNCSARIRRASSPFQRARVRSCKYRWGTTSFTRRRVRCCCSCGGCAWKAAMTRSTSWSNRCSPGNRHGLAAWTRRVVVLKERR